MLVRELPLLQLSAGEAFAAKFQAPSLVRLAVILKMHFLFLFEYFIRKSEHDDTDLLHLIVNVYLEDPELTLGIEGGGLTLNPTVSTISRKKVLPEVLNIITVTTGCLIDFFALNTGNALVDNNRKLIKVIVVANCFIIEITISSELN